MNLKDIQIRDPFVLKDQGFYWLFGSTDKDIWNTVGTGFDAYKSSDLIDWEGPIAAFRPPLGYWGTYDFWAPEVHKYKDKFYMFASFRGEGNRGTAALVSDSPEGPYEPLVNGPLTPADWMCLDGTFHVDPDGQPWLVFSHEWVQIGDGTICAMKLSEDLTHAVSSPEVLLKSTDAPYTAKAASPTWNMVGYVTDGPNIFRMKSGKLLMLWSCMGEKGYCIGYAISENEIQGPWKQHLLPLYDKDGGHGMIFSTYEGKLFLAVHSPNDTPNERAVFLEIEDLGDSLALKG
ncbi:MAG: glycoside hydrolase family 43 protein [Clostridiales bacterium]|jgi:beta-xylosidase|nr:glycoside hydrolase family 43 protein [Clostridiales bacterium]